MAADALPRRARQALRALSLAWLPNAITFARMGLAAPMAWAILADRHALAFGLALVAGLSDAIDGWLAKRYGWGSWLGGIIDPIADKLMLLAAYVSLGVVGALPWWIVGLVAGRDLVIVAGAVAYHRLVGRLTAAPSLLSKATTLLQISFALLLLLDGFDRVAVPPLLLDAMLYLVATATVASGIHYVVTWSRKARRERRAPGAGAVR